MASLSSMLGGIKSVQRGVFAGSTTETTINISPVNPAKAFVSIASFTDNIYTLRIASSTTLLATSGNYGPQPLYWEVIEFY